MNRIVKLISLLPITSSMRGQLYSLLFRNKDNKYGRNFRIGFGSYINASQVIIGDDVHIDNFVRIKFLDKFSIGDNSSIGSSTIVCGAMKENKASICELVIGNNSNILCSHYFDVVAPITIGDYVTIGGKWSQFYTHSFDLSGARLDGEIRIGDHVYIGAGCIINLGVNIGSQIVVTAGTCLSQSIKSEGVYANSKLIRKGNVHEYKKLYGSNSQFAVTISGTEVYRKHILYDR